MASSNKEDIGSTALSINKQEPVILEKQVLLFDRATDYNLEINTFEAREQVLITAFYSNGLTLLNQLKNILTEPYQIKPLYNNAIIGYTIKIV